MSAVPRPLTGPAVRGVTGAEPPAAPDTLLPAGPSLPADDVGPPTVGALVVLTLLGVVLVIGYLELLRWLGGE